MADEFGFAVDVGRNLGIVGARKDGDGGLNTGSAYGFVLRGRDADGNGIPDDCELLDAPYDGGPGLARLLQSVPNPFNPVTTIPFELPAAADVRLRIFDVSGPLRSNARRRFEPRRRPTRATVARSRRRSGAPVASGVYFYRLDAGRFQAVRRMVLLK